MKTTIEETLTRRLCRYLGLEIATKTLIAKYGLPSDRVVVYPPDALADALIFSTFRAVLFGGSFYVGLRDLPKRKYLYPLSWGDTIRKAFEYSSLDELEMQLSVRGF